MNCVEVRQEPLCADVLYDVEEVYAVEEQKIADVRQNTSERGSLHRVAGINWEE